MWEKSCPAPGRAKAPAETVTLPAAQDSRWASQLLENHLGSIFTFPGELSQLLHAFPVILFNSDTQGGAGSLSFEAHWSISGFPGASVGEITNLNQNKNVLQMR